MNNDKVNWIFLTKCCDFLKDKGGYLQYRYQIGNSKNYILITIEENEFNISFVNYLSDYFYIVIEGTQSQLIPHDSYLSREIHKFL